MAAIAELQPLPAAYMYLCIHDILYMHDIHVHVYIQIYIHFYICVHMVLIFTHNHMVKYKICKFVTITIKNTFLAENEMTLDFKI